MKMCKRCFKPMTKCGNQYMCICGNSERIELNSLNRPISSYHIQTIGSLAQFRIQESIFNQLKEKMGQLENCYVFLQSRQENILGSFVENVPVYQIRQYLIKQITIREFLRSRIYPRTVYILQN